MRRVTTALALALCLLGCGAKAPSGDSLPLLTGSLGCWAGGEQGSTAPLVVDQKYGTSFGGRPVMWPGGYTARRVGGEVVVLDGNDNVKATTGRTYHISYAYAPALTYPTEDSARESPAPTNGFPAAVACGHAWDFIDCTDASSAPGSPADTYC
jgi:hypothetical protein